MTAYEPKAVQTLLWRRGELEWKLRPYQKNIYKAIRNHQGLKYVVNAARRIGKSYLTEIMAIEDALASQNAIVRLIAPSIKMLKNITLPLFRHITEDAPWDVRPVWKASESKFFLPITNSEILLSGANNGHEDDARGTSCNSAYIDEAGFVDNLTYLVEDVLIPQLLTTKGKLILMSTAPRSPSHDFAGYANKAEQEGNYSRHTIYEAGFDERLLAMFRTEAGGENSTTWKREYLCQFVVDENYAIIPEWKDHYTFHVMYQTEKAQRELESRLPKDFIVDRDEKIPHRHSPEIDTHPILWRYFLKPREFIKGIDEKEPNEEELVVRTVMDINANLNGAYIFSSGKNMGIFKAVGYPEDVADFFRLENYEGYLWTAHGRFPTNTPGWWGGAHPFGLLNWSVVHNGEISSYGINKRYLEMFGYKCSLMTDTEVVAYLADLLIRKHRMSMDTACKVLAPKFWKDIEKAEPGEKSSYTALRQYYGSAMLNGPFAILIGHNGSLLGLSDRIKLRPLVAARKDNTRRRLRI